MPLLNDEEMRGACAGLMPSLLEAMQKAQERGTWANATPQAVQELYEKLMKALLKVRAGCFMWGALLALGVGCVWCVFGA